jgi:hypothetical protein
MDLTATSRTREGEPLEETTEQALYRGSDVLRRRASEARDLDCTELGEVTDAAQQPAGRASLEEIVEAARTADHDRHRNITAYAVVGLLLAATAGVLLALLAT